MNKLVSSVKEAVRLSGLKDGMTISFHHHLRNGDFVLNMVLEAAAELGIKDLTVNASSLFEIHAPLVLSLIHIFFAGTIQWSFPSKYRTNQRRI